MFSAALGIDLPSREPGQIFRWLLASLLFGARISERIAVNTYREFERAGVLSPATILATGWQGLVDILDRGTYVRYDFKTATKLLEVSRTLLDRYGGDLNALHREADDTLDLECRIKDLGKGMGDITANIFLREMRGIWAKAEPLPGDLVCAAARDLGLVEADATDPRGILDSLRSRWLREGMPAAHFSDLEAALVRHGKALRAAARHRAGGTGAKQGIR
jgi:endonuclease III